MKASVARLLPVAVLGALLLALPGCAAGPHQVIGANDECPTCHSDQKATYEVDAGTVNAAQAGSTVAVETQASEIAVCRPTFTAQDGSYFVPVEVRTVPVVDGRATVELEDGLWALCIDKGDTATSMLVSADSSFAANTNIAL